MADAKTKTKGLEYYLSLSYPVQLSKQSEDDEEYWLAEILDLPGCMADGVTPEEAMENIEEAKFLWINSQLEDGHEVPEPSDLESYSGKTLVRMPKMLHRKLAYQAQREGVSLNHYIVSLLAEGAKAEEQIRELNAIFSQLSTQINVVDEFKAAMLRLLQLMQMEINAREGLRGSTVLSVSQGNQVGTDVEGYDDPIDIRQAAFSATG